MNISEYKNRFVTDCRSLYTNYRNWVTNDQKEKYAERVAAVAFRAIGAFSVVCAAVYAFTSFNSATPVAYVLKAALCGVIGHDIFILGDNVSRSINSIVTNAFNSLKEACSGEDPLFDDTWIVKPFVSVFAN